MTYKLRETTTFALSLLRKPSFWLIMVGVSVLCYLAGPFGTLGLPDGFRFVYWMIIVLGTATPSLWFFAWIQLQNQPSIIYIVSVSLLFGIVVGAIVILLSLALLLPLEHYPGHITLFLYSFSSAVVIFTMIVLIAHPAHKKNNAPHDQRPALFKRLEKYKNAKRIVSLSAQDHYVEVTTELGAELCLIRLSDAIAQSAPQDGFQIHRSHWVARDAIRSYSRKNGNTVVELSNGVYLGVSKSRIAAFKAFYKTADVQR